MKPVNALPASHNGHFLPHSFATSSISRDQSEHKSVTPSTNLYVHPATKKYTHKRPCCKSRSFGQERMSSRLHDPA